MRVHHLFIIVLIFSNISGAASSEPVSPKNAHEHFHHARNNFEAGLYSIALEELTQFVETWPRSKYYSLARLMLAQAAYHLGEVDQAVGVLSETIADKGQKKNHLEAAYWLGLCRLKKGETDLAAELFTQVSAGRSKALVPLALNGLGQSYYGQKKYTRAIEVFDQIVSDFPDSAHLVPAVMFKARCMIKQDRLDQTKALLLGLMEQHGETKHKPEIFYLLGEAEIYLENYSDALAYYKLSTADTEPELWYPEADYGIGWCHLKMENYDKAIAAFTKITEEYAKSPVVAETLRKTWLGRGKAHFLKGDQELAEQTIEEYIEHYKLGEHRADAYFLLGKIYSAGRRQEEALEMFEKAFATGSVSDELQQKIHYHRGQVLYARGQYQLSVESFMTAASMESVNYPLALLALGRTGDAHIKLAAYEKAIARFQQIREKEPQYDSVDSVIYRIGWCYYKMGEDEKAIAAFDTLPKKYPQSGLADDALYRIAGVYYRQGEYERAIERYNQVEKEYPATDLKDKIRYQLGKCNYNLGFYDLARGFFEDMTRDYPKSLLAERAAYEIGWCHFQLGGSAEAMEHFTKLIEKNPETGFAAEILFWMGEYHYNKNDYEKARVLFEKLAGPYSKHALADGALYWAGKSAALADQPDTAMKLFRKVLKKYPQSDFVVDAGLQIGKLLMQNSEFSAADDMFFLINQKYPQNYLRDEINLRLGWCKLEQGNTRRAFAIFTELLAAEKITYRARASVGRAECMLRQKQHTRAVRELMRVVWDYPEERGIIDEAVLKAAGIYENKGDYSEAIKLYTMIVERQLPSAEQAKIRIKTIRRRSIFGL